MSYADEMNGPNFDGDIRNGQLWLNGRWHAIFAREAVLGDICDWGTYDLFETQEQIKQRYIQWYQHFAFTYGDGWEEAHRVRLPYRYRIPPATSMSFGEWAKHIRTVQLFEIHERLGERLREAEERNALLQDKINQQIDVVKKVEIERDERAEQVSRLQQQLDEQEIKMRELDKLESELRTETAIKDCYVRSNDRQHKKICDLENVIKVNADFIERQAGRLTRARQQLQRLRDVANVDPELTDPELGHTIRPDV